MRNSLHSSHSSPGIAIGVGNTGLHLSQNDDELSTYITRDGGLTWKFV